MRIAQMVKGGRLAPLYPHVRTVALAMRGAKAAAESVAAQTIQVPLRLLPTAVQARLKHSFTPVSRLDYAAHEIWLHADSGAALYRAAACRKEPETVRWIEEYVRPGDVLYNVGANVGAYSLVASKHCGGHVRVFAFEPSFATYDELCRNILSNRCETSVFPYLMCLTGSPGLVEFRHASIEPGSALHSTVGLGSASEVPAVYRQHLMGLSIDFLVAQFGFPIPNHLKIDVDGTELDVLRGAARTLASNEVRTMQIEVSPRHPSAAEVADLLARAGFRLVSETARGGGDRWSNHLYVRQ